MTCDYDHMTDDDFDRLAAAADDKRKRDRENPEPTDEPEETQDA